MLVSRLRDPALAMCLLLQLALGCQPASAVERAEVEAAIVYNILLFVEWPVESTLAAGGPLVLCVDPASRLAGPLKSLAGRPVRTHRLELHDMSAAEPWRGCHALFVDAASKAGAALRRHAKGQPLLVIGEEPAAADDGVMVRLAEADGRITFDVDLAAARQGRLQISSRLLRLARKVAE